jgi:hypothetical protein
MRGVTLDAGALIKVDKNERKVIGALWVALQAGVPITVPAGAVGQAWRNGARQSRLSRFLGSDEVTIEPLDDARARAAGQLCGATGTRDIIDASVVLCAKLRGDRIFTSDVDDLRRLDPDVELEAI